MEQDDYVYPGPRFTENGHCTGQGQVMTLRDWFAGQSSEVDIAVYREPYYYQLETYTRTLWGKIYDFDYGYKYTREEARYRYADAMLEARKK